MQVIWNEETIREELRRLDLKTGLRGAELPIKFGKAKSYLGLYYQTEGKGFYFSTYYFENPDFQVESALDVIRHEYAHYMNHIVYNGYGHDKTWKKCCEIVGASLIRCYNKERNEYHKMQHLQQSQLELKLKKYKIGQTITHPCFGKGLIKMIKRSGNSLYADVVFNCCEKRISLAWIDENCN